MRCARAATARAEVPLTPGRQTVSPAVNGVSRLGREDPIRSTLGSFDDAADAQRELARDPEA